PGPRPAPPARPAPRPARPPARGPARISWGGGLAQQFALSQRDRCRRLVLAATGTGTLMVPAHPRVLARMATLRRYLDPGYAERGAPDLNCRARPGRPPPAARGAARPSLPLLPWIRQPTLLLAGDDDPIIPLVNAHIMRRLLPHAELRVYHGGHLGLL